MFIHQTQVFVKKISISNLELSSRHFMSTSNIFNLPMYYQYGVGSAGFSGWRELEAHIVTTDYVIKGECINFPLLYHWRILPKYHNEESPHFINDIEQYCKNWENNINIRRRIENINNSEFEIVLFLEYFPSNLDQWLRAQILKSEDQAESAVALVEKQLFDVAHYLYSQGLIHFDSHFKNILTDGDHLYLSDFGLTLSLKFNLMPHEIDFFNRHQSYDQACAAVNLLHCMVTSFYDGKNWIEGLSNDYFEKNNYRSIKIDQIIKKYEPIAMIMDHFFQKLLKESKTIQYPDEQIKKLLISLF